MATPIPANRCAFTLGEAAAAVEGNLGDADPRVRATSVSIDTRTLDPGAIFVALRGVSDGHNYLARAAERGATVAIVERTRTTPALACIEVADPLEALGRLAHAHLARERIAHALTVMSIGGAAGKTTTKELAAAASRAVFGPTLHTPGNLNNRIGVPMTIFTLGAQHRAIVLECGTNTRGEIAHLAAIVEPDAAALLNVAIEHSEGIGTLDQIADEEAAIFARTRRTAVVPALDAAIRSRIPKHLRTVTFGATPDCTVSIDAREVVELKSRLSLRLAPALVQNGAERVVTFETQLIGSAAALNCAAALALVASATGEPLTPAQFAGLGAALASVAPIARRMMPREVAGLLILDDSYNAQPPSMRMAISTAYEVAAARQRRLVLILGDMLELGELAAPSHDDAIRQAVACEPAELLAVGPEMSAALARVTAHSHRHLACYAAVDSVAASALITQIVRSGDVVLIKGSLGMAMDRVVSALELLPTS